MNRCTALKRAGAPTVALGGLEAVGPFSFAPRRVGASIVPSDTQFDISAFLAVPPQDYGTGVGFADQRINGPARPRSAHSPAPPRPV
jgi:hypothetical protein